MGYFNVRALERFLFLLAVFTFPTNRGATDPRDVYAIKRMYTALESPLLTGWTLDGGDPCGLAWQGVQCVNANVTGIVLNGLKLGGQLSEDLGFFASIIQIDLRDNHIGGSLPSNLPPTIRSLYLDNNHINGVIPDVFQQLKGLVTLDFSGNNLTGQLPSSMGNLTSLITLHLQNNQLIGTLDVIQDLPLTDLNIENNLFSGPIPENLLKIPNFRRNGNPFNTTVLPSPLLPSPSPSPITGFSPQPPSPEPKLEPAPPRTGSNVKRSRNTSWIVILVIILIIIILVTLVAYFRSLCCREKPDKEKMHEGYEMFARDRDRTSHTPDVSLQSFPDESSREEKSMGTVSTELVTIEGVERFRVDLSVENCVGLGYLGAVYKAKLQDGTLVAVKKLHDRLSRNKSDKEFINLVRNLSKFQHHNIVKLVGHCLENKQWFLAYEYCKITTLHEALHENNEIRAQLSWKTRVRLALEAAQALRYLHESFKPPVVHQNFKSVNILLDKDLSVRVSDCCLASLLPLKSWAKRLKTTGYGTVELELSGNDLILKSDVYSFGVVMLELLTGQKAHDRLRPAGDQFLVRWANSQKFNDEEAWPRILDPSLNGEYSSASVAQFVELISMCIDTVPECRTSMPEVVIRLRRMIRELEADSEM